MKAEGTFALPVQHLTEEQQHILAKRISAILCAQNGISNSSDPLLGNSRSSSPYLKPQEASTSGSLDTACMQLPPPALPMHARASPLGAPQHQHLQGACHDSQCSHSSANAVGDSMPAGATPLSVFKACRLGDPCCYGSPSDHAHEATASAGQHGPAFTVEEPAYTGHAAVAAEPEPAAQQQHGSPAADDAAACQDVEMEAPAIFKQQQEAYRRPCVLNSPKGWLYDLVTCPFLFKPCPRCSATNSGREVLMTYFDTDNPTHGYCTYCPQRHSRPHLLQIRRSTYHEVVKASDVSRLTDVSGIQHYVINGSKVLFLRPRPQPRPPKGVMAPARCAVDGRQLMDAHSGYCSLRCKLEVEDVVFAANFPSSADEQQAAGTGAAAPDGSSLAGSYHRQGGHEGRRVVVPVHKHQAPQSSAPARLHSHDAHNHYDSSEGEGADGGWGARHKRHRHMPSKFANAVVGGSYQVAVAGSSRRTGPMRPHQHAGSKARDDTASDQAAAAAAATGGAGMGLAGMAGLHLLHKNGDPGEAGSRRASPCGSDDSGRSTTCSQRHKGRKKAPPCRSALQ